MTSLHNQSDPCRRPAPQGQGETSQMTTRRAPVRQLPQTPQPRPTNQHPPFARRGAWQADDEDEETEEDEALASMDEGDEAVYAPARTPRSALPYRPTHTQPYAPAPGVPSRASQPNRGLMRQPSPEPEPEPRAPRQRRRMHWLFYVGLGFCMMVLGWILLSTLSSWWQTTWDGWHYGYPRTYQTDAVVGHGDSATNPSHFIAINLHSHIEVIEFPGGDPTHARVYLGPTLVGQGQDLAPVTLTFRDVNGDSKPDMIVSVGENTFVFINDAGQFRPTKPGEQLTL